MDRNPGPSCQQSGQVVLWLWSQKSKDIFKNIYWFIWLHQVLDAAWVIFSGGMWDIVPQPGIEPGTSCIGSMES